MNSLFRKAALALRGSISDTYTLLDAADAVVRLIEDEVAAVTQPKPDPVPHEVLVRVARNTPEVMEALYAGKRINAIKALRDLFRPDGTDASGLRAQPIVGLKAAKVACEDPSFADDFNIWNAVPVGDPWAVAQDEPPF